MIILIVIKIVSFFEKNSSIKYEKWKHNFSISNKNNAHNKHNLLNPTFATVLLKSTMHACYMSHMHVDHCVVGGYLMTSN